MERCLGFVSSLIMMMMMMMMGHDENDNIYLPYMICMYVHVHEKRNGLEYKVHYGTKMKVKIFKRHRRQNLSIPIPTCIQFSRLLPAKKIEPNHSFILVPIIPYIFKCHFPAYLMQIHCEVSGHVSRASRIFLSVFSLMPQAHTSASVSCPKSKQTDLTSSSVQRQENASRTHSVSRKSNVKCIKSDHMSCKSV